eukprot:c3707_g1_i2.p1 GENE.c3707_g1_i2~~c3707_g1_i2.p1  ORF type:complete len:254 (+),score=60.04 c3707_g1_i2:367-1128(+)
MYVLSKLNGLPVDDYAMIEKRTKNMLEEMGIDCFDMLLIHWPGPQSVAISSASPDEIQSSCSFSDFNQSIQKAWKNMLELRRQGLTKGVGVSNFYSAHISALIRQFPESSEHPAVNEIFIDVCHQEREFVQQLQVLHIQPIAYRVLAFIDVLVMCKDMGDSTLDALNETCQAIADPPNVTLRQFVLAWLRARGISVVWSSNTADHIAENLASQKIQVLPDSIPFSVEEGAETVKACGGADETALAFAQTQPSA